MKNKKIKCAASLLATSKRTSKRVLIAWYPRRHREGDVWVVKTSRIVNKKRVDMPVIRITDDTIQILLGAIHEMRRLGKFKTKEESGKREDA